jgi:hypothetical protein
MTSLIENIRDDLENKCEIHGAALTEKHGWRGDCGKILKIFMGIEAIPQESKTAPPKIKVMFEDCPRSAIISVVPIRA